MYNIKNSSYLFSYLNSYKWRPNQNLELLSQKIRFWGEEIGGYINAVGTIGSDSSVVALICEKENEKDALTYMDLLSLLPAQQGQAIHVKKEGWVGLLEGIEVLDEDYINPSGCGAEPVSHYTTRSVCEYSDEEMADNLEMVACEPLVAKKGDIILHVSSCLWDNEIRKKDGKLIRL
jgi:hypothetical protein